MVSFSSRRAEARLALFLVPLLLSQPVSAAVSDAKPAVDAETVASDPAADVEREAEAFQHRQDLAKARLELCQRSTRGTAAEQYPTNVMRRLKADQELGSFERVMEICQAYLTGKVDQLKLERERLQGSAAE